MASLVYPSGDTSWKSAPLLLVGAGATSWALCRALLASDEYTGQIRVWARNEESLQRFPGLGCEVTSDLEEAVAGICTTLLCVSDSAIEEVAGTLQVALRGATVTGTPEDSKTTASFQPSNPADAGAPLVVLHCSGFRGVDALASLGQTEVGLGVMHPMAALACDHADGDGPSPFAGVTFGVSGDSRDSGSSLQGEGLARAVGLAELLGGRAVQVNDELRGLYHGAAALLSGGLVALFAETEACLAESLGGPTCSESGTLEPGSGDGNNGPDAAKLEARRILRGLLASTTQNLMDLPPEQALTGPVARGDDEVTAGHVAAFAKRSERNGPRTQELHARLTEIMAELVRLRDSGTS